MCCGKRAKKQQSHDHAVQKYCSDLSDGMQWKQDELAEGPVTAFALPDNATPCLHHSRQEVTRAPTASPLREETDRYRFWAKEYQDVLQEPRILLGRRAPHHLANGASPVLKLKACYWHACPKLVVHFPPPQFSEEPLLSMPLHRQGF